MFRNSSCLNQKVWNFIFHCKLYAICVGSFNIIKNPHAAKLPEFYRDLGIPYLPYKSTVILKIDHSRHCAERFYHTIVVIEMLNNSVFSIA